MLAEYENYILVVSMLLGFYLSATILRKEKICLMIILTSKIN